MPQGLLKSLSPFGEINLRGGLSLSIDILKVWQTFSKRAKQKVILLHGTEILTIDPHQINTPICLAGLHLVTYPAHHLGGVGDLHMFKDYAVAHFELLTHPGDIGIDRFRTGPCIEIYGLTPGFRFDCRPVRRLSRTIHGSRNGSCCKRYKFAAARSHCHSLKLQLYPTLTAS